MTVLIGMVLLGLFIGLGTWVLASSDHVKSELKVKIFYCAPSEKDSVCPKGQRETSASLNAIRSQLDDLKAQGKVKSYVLVSKEEAFAREKKANPAMVAGLTSNPFPDGWEVVPSNANDIAKIGKMFPAGQNEVQNVKWGAKTASSILQAAKVIESVFLVAILVLLASSTMLIANTIRLSIFSRRREIEVMKLVGATNWFVRGPFMIEGLITGFVGSLIAVVLLLLGKELVLPTILGHIDAGSDVSAIPFGLNALALLGVGLGLGAAGSGVTLP